MPRLIHLIMFAVLWNIHSAPLVRAQSDPKPDAVRFEDVLAAAPGAAQQVAFHRWAYPIARKPGAVSSDQVNSIMDMVKQTDFTGVLSPKEKETFGIVCRETLCRPQVLLSVVTTDINPLLLHHARTGSAKQKATAILSLGLRARLDKTINRSEVAQVLVDSHTDADPVVRVAVATSLYHFTDKDHASLIEAVRKLWHDPEAVRHALPAARYYGAAITPTDVKMIAKIGLRDQATQQTTITCAVLADIADVADEATCNAIVDATFPLFPAGKYQYDRPYQVRTLIRAAAGASADRVARVCTQMAAEANSKVAFDSNSVLTAAKELAKSIDGQRRALIHRSLSEQPQRTARTQELTAVFASN